MKMYGKHRFHGKLFVVEGIDGSGKSTQIALLQSRSGLELSASAWPGR